MDPKKFYDPSIHVPTPAGMTIARFSRYDNRSFKTMQLEFDTQPHARYGFTWRGVKRPHDREMGIAGVS